MPMAAPAISALASVALVGGSVFQGQQQKQAARRSARAQEAAQREATSQAAAEVRRQGISERKLNRRRPNVLSLLSAERRSALTGPGATALTGSTGVGRGQFMLGRSSLLGQ